MAQYSTISTVADQEQVTTGFSEESANQFTHGIGFIFSVLGSVYLLSMPGLTAVTRIGCWIYAASMIALYAASTLSHSFDSGPSRTKYRTLDQICIFTFMAGIFTPISLQACDGWWHLPLLLMWMLVGLGTWLKLRVTREEMVPVWFYILLGAVPMLAFPRILELVGTQGMMWILAASVCYLIGIVFLTNDHRSRFFHPTWHVLVMLGSVCHYVAIVEYTVTATS